MPRAQEEDPARPLYKESELLEGGFKPKQAAEGRREVMEGDSSIKKSTEKDSRSFNPIEKYSLPVRKTRTSLQPFH